MTRSMEEVIDLMAQSLHHDLTDQHDVGGDWDTLNEAGRAEYRIAAGNIVKMHNDAQLKGEWPASRTRPLSPPPLRSIENE